MNDTPETDAILKQFEHHLPNWLASEIMAEVARRLERERNSWKAAHDNQAKLKRIISDRPDLKERAKLVEELIKERDEARSDLAYRLEQYAIKQLQLSDARKTILELQKK